jgi:hypothetical protein
MRNLGYDCVLFSIVCSTVVNALVFPRPNTPAVALSTLRWAQENSNDGTTSPDATSDFASSDVDASSTSSTEQLDDKLLEEVRLELVQKYLAQGITQEEAEKEVDVFLADKDRSEKYLEMRIYASAQADDLGFGLGLQLIGGFLIGFIGIAGPKYFQAYQAANSVADVPNPLL